MSSSSSSASAFASAPHFDFATNFFLEETIPTLTLTLTKPQRRWRLGFKAIYFTRALLSLPIKRNNQILSHLSYSPQQRWRLGFKAICSTRAFLSLLIERKNQLLTHLSYSHSRSTSYSAVDINDHDYTDSTPFSIVDPKSLVALVQENDLELLDRFGGVHEVAAALNVDCKDGIHGSTENVTRRCNEFGSNDYQKPPAKGFFHFFLESFKNFKSTIILVLLIRVALSLGFSIKEDGLKRGWLDNGSISLAVLLYIFVSAISNFKKSRQFEKLSHKSNEIRVDVIRDGRRQQISIFDIVVGEIVFLKTGDQIPADGLFLDGHSLKMDKSSMTGETDHVEINGDNPFMISGAKVADGCGRMLVTSVGINTIWGKMMNSISHETEEPTPLQARLHKLTKYTENAPLFVAFIVLVVKLILYFSGKTQDEKGNREFCGRTKFEDVINAMVGIVAAADTIVMVVIPEGLPLAFTLTLVYSMNRMMAEHALLRKLSACETLGSVTTICTDKTGTLTLNQMEVAEYRVGEEAITDAASEVATNLLQLLQEGVSLNTTGSVYRPGLEPEPEFSDSPIEKAILSWAVLNLGIDVNEVRESCKVLHFEAFNSEKKRSGVLMRKKGKKEICVHWKGAAEIILALCSSYFGKTGTAKPINEGERMKFGKIIEGMAAKSLRCIAFAYKPILEVEISGNATHKLEEDGLFLLCLVGLKDPCRPKVSEAIDDCKKAGVKIKMITGENVFTAKAIAIECGILGADEDLNNEAVVEGIEFRNYSPEERKEKVDTIRVMARSSPCDKLQMVQCLKERGQIVAVIGNGTDDTPALKEADIGLWMGIQREGAPKQSSFIVILDDNFSSVVTVLKWGRCLYSNIRKLIQFQLTVYAVALVINFVSAVSSGQVPLTAVQLLWVNLIRDTLGTLALATEHPTKELLEKPPVGRTEPFITKVMWRNLIAQALYQITILLILLFKGEAIFGVEKKINDTFIFNTFVLCQVFNEFNARKLEEKNIFEGIQKNQMFVGIVGTTLVLQVLMVEFMKKYANQERLNWGQWGASIGIAALSWPIGWVFKWVSVSDKPHSV